MSRIGPLPNLPLFHKLHGRKALVVGHSNAALWKAELLAAAGATVVRVDSWTASDLANAAIAVADLSDRDEARRFAREARAAGAIVNVIDQPDLCDAQF
ncbi:MAG: NAD(P)-dependent oxidoreductase, partial [Sphingomicrobium sp.]